MGEALLEFAELGQWGLVDNDDLVRRPGLAQETSDGAQEDVGAVQGGDDAGDFHSLRWATTLRWATFNHGFHGLHGLEPKKT